MILTSKNKNYSRTIAKANAFCKRLQKGIKMSHCEFPMHQIKSLVIKNKCCVYMPEAEIHI